MIEDDVEAMVRRGFPWDFMLVIVVPFGLVMLAWFCGVDL